MGMIYDFKQWLEANARLYQSEEHPLYNLNYQPQKLDTSASPAEIVNQYLSAFQRRLPSMPQEKIVNFIDFNAKQIQARLGQNAADFFTRKAQNMVGNAAAYNADTGS